MDKAVKRHILNKRILLAKRSDEPMTFTERAPKFFKWFEEDVMGFDSEEYRREFWRESYKHGRTMGHVPHALSDQLRSRGRRSEIVLFDALCISLLMGGAFAIWVMRRRIDLHLHRLRRPSYYETERARRLRLTQARRRVRQRATTNACPTADQLRRAFLHARDSVGNMVRLGSLMEDLECYIDNSLVFGEDGRIIARKGGIRRYIQSEIPDLYKSYKTLMRYKALARRFRQAVGICDPIPAASVLPQECEGKDKSSDKEVGVEAGKSSAEHPKAAKNAEKLQNDEGIKEGKKFENMVRTNSHGGLNDEVRRVVGEILGVCEGTFLDLAAVLALRISEDMIPHRLYKGDYQRICS